MRFSSFEEIEAWQLGMKLVASIYEVTSSGTIDKDWGLKDQMRRASVSIPSNIAEGFERNSPGDFIRFLAIAKGSCGELRTQLLLAGIIGHLQESQITKLVSECKVVSGKLAGLSNYLQSIRAK